MIEEAALSSSQVDGESVEIRFVPLSALKKLGSVLWQKNAKRHDPAGILASIERYGFIDPPKWDGNLNEGQGGIIYGNGRTETIVAALLTAQKDGLPAPRGIPVARESGEWCIPVKFGVDAGSEAQAMAAAIDHNNLTMAGGDFDAAAIAKIWDEDYIGLLSAIAEEGELPVTVDADDLASLLAIDSSSGDPEEDIVGANDQGKNYESKYAIAIECENEEHQEMVFNLLMEEGYKCKILVL